MPILSPERTNRARLSGKPQLDLLSTLIANAQLEAGSAHRPW